MSTAEVVVIDDSSDDEVTEEQQRQYYEEVNREFIGMCEEALWRLENAVQSDDMPGFVSWLEDPLFEAFRELDDDDEMTGAAQEAVLDAIADMLEVECDHDGHIWLFQYMRYKLRPNEVWDDVNLPPSP